MVGLCVSSLALAAVRKHPAKPRPKATPWQQAEQMREKLEHKPENERSKAEYASVLDAYREIYHHNPGDLHAPPAIFAVGELLAEQSRSTGDPKSAQAALGQFEFLRKQYPGSSLRIPALLAEGIIAQNDLHDTALARSKYDELLRRYPKSQEAQDARTGLDSLKQTKQQPAVAVAPVPRNVVAKNDPPAKKEVAPKNDSLPAMPLTSGAPSGSPLPSQAAVDQLTQQVANAGTAPAKKGGLAQVTGIRHWSTPDYTRVAIDLGDEVQYEAARVPGPDRIFFDLHGTRLAHELAGKNFNVTDDGFLKRIRAAQFSNDVTRVVLDVSDVTEYSAFLLPNPYRLIIDIHGGKKDDAPKTANAAAGMQPPAPKSETQGISNPPSDPITEDVPPPPMQEKTVAPVAAVPSTIATKSATAHEVANLGSQPDKVKGTPAPTSQPIAVMETTAASLPSPGDTVSKRNSKQRGKKNTSSIEPNGHTAVPTSAGETSLVRALGLKVGRIVIDAGHGGHDSGTLGVDGLMEKDVVLDVALRLGKALHERLGAEIIYTRSDDTFIPLETRTAIANKAQADLFLSIHANSSPDGSARGVETYYLNFTSQPDALEVAARENAVSNQSVSQLSDLVKKITLKDKIEESREFAFDVEQSLYAGLQKGNDGLKNRGIKKAPFVVLIGANMPSILTEISFVTNPKDASQLRQPE